MMSFLREFVDNDFAPEGLRRKVVEGRYHELMFNLPPDLTASNRPSLLYPDRMLVGTSLTLPMSKETRKTLTNYHMFLVN